MPITAERLQVVIEAEVDKALKDFKKVDKATKKTGDNFKKFGSVLKGGLVAGATIVATKAVFNLGKELFNAAAAAEETTSKFNAVFKEQAGETKAWAEEYSKAFGLSSTETLGFLATLQDTFVPLGFARDQAADLSTELVSLAGDLSSFNNVARDDVVRDLQSALVGNTETLRKYGIVASQAAIVQEAINSGLINTKDELDAASKAQAIYQLTVKGTADAQGDLERTQDSAANTVRRFESRIEDLKIAAGAYVTEAATPLISSFSGIIEKITEAITKTEEFANIQTTLGEDTRTLEDLQAQADEQQKIIDLKENSLRANKRLGASEGKLRSQAFELLALAQNLSDTKALIAIKEQEIADAERERVSIEEANERADTAAREAEEKEKAAAIEAERVGKLALGLQEEIAWREQLEGTINSTSAALTVANQKAIDEQEQLNERLEIQAQLLTGLQGIFEGLIDVSNERNNTEISNIDERIQANKDEGLSTLALEQEKERLQRQNFNRNKAVQLLNVGVNTASAIAASLDDAPFPANLAIAGVIGAAGAAQAAAIASKTFQTGTGSSGFVVPPGFEGDNFPVSAQSGERVTIERPNQPTQQRQSVTLMIDRRVLGKVIFEGTQDGEIKISERAVV